MKPDQRTIAINRIKTHADHSTEMTAHLFIEKRLMSLDANATKRFEAVKAHMPIVQMAKRGNNNSLDKYSIVKEQLNSSKNQGLTIKAFKQKMTKRGILIEM